MTKGKKHDKLLSCRLEAASKWNVAKYYYPLFFVSFQDVKGRNVSPEEANTYRNSDGLSPLLGSCLWFESP